MKITQYNDKESWLLARYRKITGSRAKDIISTGGFTKENIISELEKRAIVFKKTAKKEDLLDLMPKEGIQALMNTLPKKIGFYELVAERLSVIPDGENPMDRGNRLEQEAIDRFVKETGKNVDSSLVMWHREDNESIAISPDGFVVPKKKDGKITEAVEVKCLASARHIEAWLTKDVPSEYEYQKRQYFVVNDDLETLHFVFYDDRIPAKDFFVLTFHRKDMLKEIQESLDYQVRTLEEVNKIVNELTF